MRQDPATPQATRRALPIIFVTLALTACAWRGADESAETDAARKREGFVAIGPMSVNTQHTSLFVAKRTYDAKEQIHYWVDNSLACGPSGRPNNYFQERFRTSFEGKEWTVYMLLKDKKPIVTFAVVPNAMDYDSLDRMKEDFFACDKGIPQAVALNEEWLVLALSAGEEADVETQLLAKNIIGSVRLP